MSITSVDLVFSTVLSCILSKTSDDYMFPTKSTRILFISPDDFVFSTKSHRILSISPNDYVFSTILSKLQKIEVRRHTPTDTIKKRAQAPNKRHLRTLIILFSKTHLPHRKPTHLPRIARRLTRCGRVGSIPLGIPNPFLPCNVRSLSFKIASSALVRKNLRFG